MPSLPPRVPSPSDSGSSAASDVADRSASAALDNNEDDVVPPALLRMFDAAAPSDSAPAAVSLAASPAEAGHRRGTRELCIRLGTDGTAAVFDAADAPNRSFGDETLFEVRLRGVGMSVTSLRYNPPAIATHTHGRRRQPHPLPHFPLASGTAPAMPSWFHAVGPGSGAASPAPAPGSPDSVASPSTGARRSTRVRALFDSALGVVDAAAGPASRPGSAPIEAGMAASLDLSARAMLRHIATGRLGDALLEAASPQRAPPRELR